MRHLVMTGTGIDLDSPMWSLIYELRISMILPLLVIVSKRFGFAAILAGAVLTLASVILNGRVPEFSHASSWISTGIYPYFFLIGILLALHADKAKVTISALPRPWIGFLWVVALTGLTIAPGDTSHVTTLGNGLLLLANGLAAGLIISLSIVDGTAAHILMGRVARYLGRISYSLYLTHLVVIVSVLHVAVGIAPLPVAVIGAIALAIVTADIFQRCVEAPSQRFGKLAAARIGSRRPAELEDKAPEPAF
jgi:peptidoglycan/LPS O-acetylase OafA/YrhL